ncbi:RES domain-containing protein [Adhaeribacter arboris]|uniref:RES domain-containing protein n=1 Tax=Adhaeribacter arboris TaxID=2072846 RepID=A0A2T2YK36_9BACT|nr:RES family NAD+ phosphorylase [Adhaeribacter arboris]PSR55876.1 RES domain-containing protein [Adhaeribacter arboris]
MPEGSTSLSTERPVVAYRLVKERFINSPLSTEGARRYGGRWNPPGIGILYTSASPELALLEQLVHLPALPYEDLPHLFLVTLALPELPVPLPELPPDWREEAEYQVNYQALAEWLANPKVLALEVPSAVVVESKNYLLHPRHLAYARVEVINTSPFNIDARLWRDRQF